MSSKFQESHKWPNSKFLPLVVVVVSHQTLTMETSSLPRLQGRSSIPSRPRTTLGHLVQPLMPRPPWTSLVFQFTLKLLALTSQSLRLQRTSPRPQCNQVFSLHLTRWRARDNRWTRPCRIRWWIVEVAMKTQTTREVGDPIPHRMNRWENRWWCKWWWLGPQVELTHRRWCRKCLVVAHLTHLILELICYLPETTKRRYSRLLKACYLLQEWWKISWICLKRLCHKVEWCSSLWIWRKTLQEECQAWWEGLLLVWISRWWMVVPLKICSRWMMVVL